MATADPAKHLQDEVTCSICLDYFKDPVMITNCQHDFCRACITKYWERSGASICCPDCRRKASWQSLKPNRRLANLVEAAKQLRMPLEQSPGREKMCKEHKKPLSLFCKTENTLICMFCERSEAHRNHRVISAERAAADYKFSAAASPPQTCAPRYPLPPVASMPPASRAVETAAADRSGSNAFSLMGTAQTLPPPPSSDPSSTQGQQQVLYFSSSADEEPPRKRFEKCPAKKHPCKKRHHKSSKCQDSDSKESTSDSDSKESTSDSDSKESTSDSDSKASTSDSDSKESTTNSSSSSSSDSED